MTRQSSLAAVRSTGESNPQNRRLPTAADPVLLEKLGSVQSVCLAAAAVIAAGILCGWLIPAAGSLLFRGWALMKANTALLLLLSALSLALSQSRSRVPKPGLILASKLLAVVVLLVAVAVLFEYSVGISLGIDTLLAADKGSPQPGRMSPQTAVAFVLLGLILLFIRVRNRAAGMAVDFLIFCLCPLVMVIVSGYAFGVMRFFGLSANTRTSPQTLVGLMLLSFVAFSRRTETGYYSVLTGTGIGGRIARIAAPVALLVPFGLEAVRFGTAQAGILSAQYATAVVTAIASVLGFVLILVLAWRINSLEQRIHDLSLRDDLTGLYNRRGFFMLAERELRSAQRSVMPFSVLFLDLDGLKQVNDTLGHEVGSEFIRETATLIRANFRESDVAGRIGGDEFVVACVANEAGMAQATQRLLQAATALNAEPGRLYSLGFSVGVESLAEDHPDSLDAMLKRADIAMYEAKRKKRGTAR